MYSVSDLGILPGGTYSCATKLNDSGQVTGWADNRSGGSRAFIWQQQMQELGTLGGSRNTGYNINNPGAVTGIADTGVSAAANYHAFLWTPKDGMKDLGTLGGPTSMGLGLNSSGQVVGESASPVLSHAFLWSAGSGMQDLGTLGGPNSRAAEINDAGLIAGDSQFSFTDLRSHAVVHLTTLTDLTGDPSTSSEATTVNNMGDVAGVVGFAEAFEWNALKGMQILGTLGSMQAPYISDINDNGDIVGNIQSSAGSSKAIIRNKAGFVFDLNLLIPASTGWLLEWASGINNHGQIVGCGFHNGQRRAYLLTPIKSGGLGQAIIAEVSKIVFGVVAGSSGVILGTTGFHPVPSPDPVWDVLSPKARDACLGIALSQLAARISDAKAYQEIRDLGRKLMKVGLEDLLSSLDQ